jgi:hypothetical protein
MPARLMTPITPKRLKIDKVRLNMLNQLRKEGRKIVKDFKKTVETWDEKPKFEFLIGLSKGDASLIIGPTGPAKLVEIYGYINNGTPPHAITASPGVLIFQENYNAKTSPGIVGSSSGGSSGGWVRKHRVAHPGIEARDFTVIIVKNNLLIFQDNMQEASRIVV